MSVVVSAVLCSFARKATDGFVNLSLPVTLGGTGEERCDLTPAYGGAGGVVALIESWLSLLASNISDCWSCPLV